MKIRLANSARSSGSAVIVVLVLLFMMTALLTANSLALHRCKQSLQSIERRQTIKYGAPARPAKGSLIYNTSSPSPSSPRPTAER
jgi:hypothetical protein